MTDDDLSPDEWVANPIADHIGAPVPRWHAAQLAPLVPDYQLVRRAAGAAVAGNYPALDQVLDEIQKAGCTESCLRVALTELALCAVDGAEGDRDVAEQYFSSLVAMQQRMDGGQ